MDKPNGKGSKPRGGYNDGYRSECDRIFGRKKKHFPNPAKLTKDKIIVLANGELDLVREVV